MLYISGHLYKVRVIAQVVDIRPRLPDLGHSFQRRVRIYHQFELVELFYRRENVTWDPCG